METVQQNTIDNLNKFLANEKLRLNIGSGAVKMEGFLNIDSQESNKPDLVLDITKTTLPFQANVIDEICFFHCIEHIEEKFHDIVLGEFWRVLKPEGILLISYPEFLKCVENYRNNYKGNREFFKHTIYGRQLHPGDFHVTLMDTQFFKLRLKRLGFEIIKICAEKFEEYNTVIKVKKNHPFIGRDELLKKEIYT